MPRFPALLHGHFADRLDARRRDDTQTECSLTPPYGYDYRCAIGVTVRSSPYRSSPDFATCAQNVAPTLAPPEGLEILPFTIGSDEYVVLTFRAPTEGGGGRSMERLTPSERAIVGLVAQGRSTAEIARARGTSASTVANQLSMIYRKVGVGSRRELGALGRSADKATP
jgi:DNA-binding CsgD family transcriptional regulator